MYLVKEIKISKLWASLLALVAAISPVGAEEIRVAVASNFSGAAKAIAGEFERQSGHTVTIVSGSSGKHYAQIINGAPFDAFFSADRWRPERLEREGVAEAGSRFTYALGRVVLWSPEPGLVDGAGEVLESGAFRHLALANPKLAPYGRAAQQILQGRGVWQPLQGRIVRGENIAQTFHFIKSGNVKLGFVAYSQISQPGEPFTGSLWVPPQPLYTPIEQQAVLLSGNGVARAFISYIKSDEVQEIIRGFGYGIGSIDNDGK
ncbi:MAG: molybdate ABC transporter substrate-binding protein [Gammaproteobacteria bacterium]|nr:molybdate ABC transporter substrate-binding protein [Gammaproteobacteria bacterium]MBT7308087.1 molybdate ABC transporter substrate-binding protein [Gammaproteobacteria bacterium]